VIRRLLGEKGLTILDTLITLCLIGLLTGLVIPRYQRVAHVAQEEAVRTTLMNIRSSINLFRMMNGRNPASLRELIDKNVMLPARIGSDPYSGSIFKQKYLMMNAVDAAGNILDAFGNPFTYNSAAGEVRSGTKGYETW
jgi:type II secretory pathway pseudopilin PulG